MSQSEQLVDVWDTGAVSLVEDPVDVPVLEPRSLTVEERQRRREAVIQDLESARRRRRRPGVPYA